MQTVLIVIHLLIAVALICVVLMQRTAQDGGGLTGGGGGGTMGGLFTARGSANLLTRTTAILATLFMAMSLLLGILAAQKHTARTVAEQAAEIVDTQTQKENKAENPAAPEAPKAPKVPVSK